MKFWLKFLIALSVVVVIAFGVWAFFFKEKDEGMINGVIISKIFKGVNYQYTVMVGKNEVIVKSTQDYPLNVEIGMNIYKDSIHFLISHIHLNLVFLHLHNKYLYRCLD